MSNVAADISFYYDACNRNNKWLTKNIFSLKLLTELYGG
jgi:hypothetical protein